MAGTTAVLAQSSFCSGAATHLHLVDPPYNNYFYSDCHTSAHVITRSPLATSDLGVITPRLLIAWPAGNSGIASFFDPENGERGTLSIQLEDLTKTGETLEPIYMPNSAGTSDNPTVGISGVIDFNSSAVLTLSILGSIRAIRDFNEGGNILHPSIQDAMVFAENAEGATVSRTWFDNVTTTDLTFMPLDGADTVKISRGASTKLHFGPGNYQFNASFNYPQLTQLSPQAVLNDASRSLIGQFPDQTASLSFLSYTDKLLAGTWRFLTYFGRDSMISLLLLQSVLSEGENGAIEAVIRAVLQRVNRNDGSTCHEEVIGDYATFLNLQNGINSTDPQYDYKMIDTDYFLPIILKNYFVDTETGRSRRNSFLGATALFPANHADITYGKLAQLTAEKIMRTSAPFASEGGQTKDNLIHLNQGERVGDWRDSNIGLGGGRIPYDVNTALVPAALRSIAALSAAGVFPDHPDWNETANKYAQIWEDETLQFFEVVLSQIEANSLLSSYASESSFPGPINNLTSDIKFYGLSLDGSNTQPIVRVMNTDDCFRHFLLDTTNQAQLSSFLEQTADHILQPFPAGLSSDVGLLVSNPAYGGDPFYAETFTNKDYHGTVVWGWQLAMMAAGLARQLRRCEDSSNVPGKSIHLPSCGILCRILVNSS